MILTEKMLRVLLDERGEEIKELCRQLRASEDFAQNQVNYIQKLEDRNGLLERELGKSKEELSAYKADWFGIKNKIRNLADIVEDF